MLGPSSYRPEQAHWAYVADFVSTPLPNSSTLPGFDVFVILSGADTIAEFDSFATKRAADLGRPAPRYKALNFSVWMSDADANKLGKPGGMGGIIGAKVYFALAVLHSCYEFILRLDAEVAFLRPDLVESHVRSFVSTGLIFANSGERSSNRHVLIEADYYLVGADQERWRNMSEDHSLFFGSMRCPSTSLQMCRLF